MQSEDVGAATHQQEAKKFKRTTKQVHVAVLHSPFFHEIDNDKFLELITITKNKNT